ncbi:hypothetical protein FQN53_005621 [Emmonsiellopsis sp. PD_33]|nr:hypothetical protein FQN53_005621 [Emmonsiellopsis sp. PD_33]
MASSTVHVVKRGRQKQPSFTLQKPQKGSLPAFTKTASEELGITSVYHSDLSSLEFNEFSLLDLEDPSLSVASEWHEPLFEYLQEHFGVEDMWVMPPFLVLRCPGQPDPTDRPFTVSGCIAIWLSMEEPVPPLTPSPSGGDIDSDVEVEERLVNEFALFKMPKPETLFALLQYFTGAVAISLIFHTIVVEFDEADEDTWGERIESLPFGFKNIPHTLSYSNGTLANAEFKRLKAPSPRILKDIVVDDSDYVSTTSSFNPGAMLCSDQDDAVSAGVMVEKDSKCRLTVAMHCWDKELKENPEKLGDPDSFTVRQGDTKVGYVSERIGSTDIGLAKLHDDISFDNRFLDIDTAGKVLVPSSQVNIGDEFLIDSFVTGHQRLVSAGVRVLGKQREQDPSEGKHAVIHQGIYATNDPKALSSPKLRSGICGSAIVRLKRARQQSKCLEDGEVCGFVHYADLAMMKHSPEARYYCLGDPVDSLINDGWKCVSVPEKRVSAEDNPALKRRRL